MRELLMKKNFEPKEPEYTLEELLEFGVVVGDKHPGPTSTQFAAEVRRLFNAKKAGHGGTLDPMVSGVLPILLNRASRLAQFLLEAGKEYVALIKIHKEIDEGTLLKALKAFKGPIYQRPPARSSVARRLRIRHVYDFKLIEFTGREAIVRRSVQSGTYIRKLVHDMGLYIGVMMHMAELRRVRSGPFREEEALNLLELRCLKSKYDETGDEKYLRLAIRPMERAVEHLPKIYMTYKAAVSVAYGGKLFAPGVLAYTSDLKKGSYVALFDPSGRLIAIGISEVSAEELGSMDRGLVARPKSVLRRPDEVRA